MFILDYLIKEKVIGLLKVGIIIEKYTLNSCYSWLIKNLNIIVVKLKKIVLFMVICPISENWIENFGKSKGLGDLFFTLVYAIKFVSLWHISYFLIWL